MKTGELDITWSEVLMLLECDVEKVDRLWRLFARKMHDAKRAQRKLTVGRAREVERSLTVFFGEVEVDLHNGVLLGVLTIATVVLGIFWGPLFDFADRSARFFIG